MIIKYINDIGDVMLNIDNEYILFDNADLKPRCEIFDEENFNKYLDAGYKKDKSYNERTLIGICKCNKKIYDGNRIKARDYFECPSCKRISSRKDLS